MSSNKALRILNQEVNAPVEGNWLVPCRVVAGSEGAHFLMTFTKPAVMPDEPFYKAVELIAQEMGKLKRGITGATRSCGGRAAPLTFPMGAGAARRAVVHGAGMVAFSPDNKLAFVCSSFSPELAGADAATYNIIKRSPVVGPFSPNIFASKDGQQV